MSECTCASCVSLCRHAPGWMTPPEAEAAIAGGYAYSLMLDYYIGDPDIYLLCPAVIGREGVRAPNTNELFGGSSFSMFRPPPPKGICTMLKDGRCLIHSSGFKPRQCRDALGCKGTGTDNKDVAVLWNNAAAQELVRRWLGIVGLSENVFEECT